MRRTSGAVWLTDAEGQPVSGLRVTLDPDAKPQPPLFATPQCSGRLCPPPERGAPIVAEGIARGMRFSIMFARPVPTAVVLCRPPQPRTILHRP